jgi:thiamine biosynthesis lipoprotein ApbE
MPAKKRPDGPAKVKAARFTDHEWQVVVASAEAQGKTPEQFVREATLGTAVSGNSEEILNLGGAAIPGPENEN